MNAPAFQQYSRDTDTDWERWGAQDPYFGVITAEEFRQQNLTEEARRRFFESGETHVQYVLSICRRKIDAQFSPRRVLDFGCGVGRVAIPFAFHAEEVVGADVSNGMLIEAERNREARQTKNVQFVRSDDTLSALSGKFDLIHSFIVFQHIDISRGRDIFAKLIERLRPNGICAVHFTYAKARFSDTFGAPDKIESPAPLADRAENSDPWLLMNSYDMNKLLFTMQSAGAKAFHTEFTDHGGELGVFLFFQI